MNQPKSKTFNFAFPSKKNKATQEEQFVSEGKRKITESIESSNKKLKTIDDEDELLASAGLGPSISSVTEQQQQQEEEEEDPLDAFMADMNEKAKSEKSEPKIRRDDIEEEDELEKIDENANSDDEVYAAAAAVDRLEKQFYDDDDDVTTATPTKKEIEPLARVDHSTIEYIPIEKNFYEEHPDIAAL
ncbi:unnamed protein product [Rhizopus microsporus]